MLNLMINSDSLVSKSLGNRFRANGHDIITFRLPDHDSGDDTTMQYFEQLAECGHYCRNIYIDLIDSSDEIGEFSCDANSAIKRVEWRLKEVLKVLKYGVQHMARSDGGCIWVLCCDHSVSFSVDTQSNPITNYAVMAAVQSIAKEVDRFDVKVNLMMIHPPKESVDIAQWRKAKKNLHVYGLKYKPQPAEHIAETLQMYAELKNMTTTGGVIPVGSGVTVCNF